MRDVFFMEIILILSTRWISLINTFLSGHQIYTNAFSFFFRHFGLFCSSPFTGDIKTLYKTVFKMRIIETIFSNWKRYSFTLIMKINFNYCTYSLKFCVFSDPSFVRKRKLNKVNCCLSHCYEKHIMLFWHCMYVHAFARGDVRPFIWAEISKIN